MAAQVRIAVRALRRSMAQLGLDRLDRVPPRGGLARHGMTPDPMAAELAKTERPLYLEQRACVVIDLLRETSVHRKKELRARVPPDVRQPTRLRSNVGGLSQLLSMNLPLIVDHSDLLDDHLL
jgi:hypothetical protein